MKNSPLYRFRTLLVLLVGICGAASAAQAPEAIRHQRNAEGLAKMVPSMRPKVAAIIRDMESHGKYPVINADVWRSPARQAQLKAQGFSKVSYSFHTVTGKGNKPESCAADIACFYKGWGVTPDFWLLLAASARTHQLETGVKWGLKPYDRLRIDAAIARRDWNAKLPLGWDTAHVQPTSGTLTLGQARAGRRPVFGKGGRS